MTETWRGEVKPTVSPACDSGVRKLARGSEPKVRIGGITFVVSGLTAAWTWRGRERFEAVQGDDPPDVEISVHVGHPGKGLSARDLVHSVEGLRNVYLDETTWSFEFCPYRREIYPQRPPYQVLIFDRQFSRADLYVSVDTQLERPDFNLGLYLLDLLPVMLPFHDGLMLHAGGVSDGGNGLVFAGDSGAGKTTLATIWRGHDGVRVLNDDRTIVRKVDGQWWVHSVPTKGDVLLSSPHGAELKAAFVISHSTENQARRLSEAEAAISLLTHISLPQYDSAVVVAGLALLEDLVAHVPTCQLGFLPDESAITFMREVVLREQAEGSDAAG